MLREDLERYNEADHRPGSFRYWRNMVHQAYTHPGLIAVVVFRFGAAVRRCRVPVLRQILDIVYQIQYAFVRFGLQIEIPRDTQIGPGFRIDHYGSILVNSGAVIGRNVTISQGVLIGATENGVPTIGDDVYVGVGAKILGPIRLGNCIKIGAGAIVTRSFEGHVVLAGVPAKPLRRLDVLPLKDGWIPNGTSDPAAMSGAENGHVPLDPEEEDRVEDLASIDAGPSAQVSRIHGR